MQSNDWATGKPSATSIKASTKHFLTIADFNSEQIKELLELAEQLRTVRQNKQGSQSELFAASPQRQGITGKSLAAIFEKPSTRTRSALCVAAFEGGALAQCFSPAEIHLGEKESIADTARVLSQFFSAIAWRGHSHAAIQALAEASQVPVINLLSDTHHPTQALADVQTMMQEFCEVAGKRLVFLGDVTNNVARSLCEIAQKLSFTVVLCGPKRFAQASDLPRGDWVCFEPDPHKAVRGADVLYTDVWTSMGFEKSNNDNEYLPYQVNKSLFMATGKDSTIFMHCLPACREKEVTGEVMDSRQSRVIRQAENRLHTIKALLFTLL